METIHPIAQTFSHFSSKKIHLRFGMALPHDQKEAKNLSQKYYRVILTDRADQNEIHN